MLDVFGVARHQHFHEGLGCFMSIFALDKDFFDILIIKVTNRTFNEITLFMNKGWGDGFESCFSDFTPQAREILVIALDFCFCAFGACRADNDAHALRDFKFAHHGFQTFAVCAISDFARDTPAARCIGHKDAIAASQ